MVATSFDLIGKEANRVAESGETDPAYSAVEEFTDLGEYFGENNSKMG